MIENLNPIPEEQANLHIVENMDVNNLPELMKSVLSLAHTPAEQAQYERWKAVCQEASRIAKDPNHPRYQEMVERHAAQLRGKPDPVLGKKRICQFGNFVRAVLIHEMCKN